MTSWITWGENALGQRTLAGYGGIDGNRPELIPSSSTPSELVALPSPLNQFCSNWNEAFQSGLTQFYVAPATSTVLQLVPITSYYYPVSAYDTDPLYIIVVKRPGETDWYGEETPVVRSFFTQAYPGKEIDPPLTWDDIKRRGLDIIGQELTPYVNSSVITGEPIDPSVIAVQAVCADPESEYVSPMDALPNFQQGAAGVALNLGQSWPPPLA